LQLTKVEDKKESKQGVIAKQKGAKETKRTKETQENSDVPPAYP
jgi:hypothetical protein